LLDWDRRYTLMRYHSAAHIIMAASRQEVSGYAAKGIAIAADLSGCEVRFSALGLMDDAITAAIERTAIEVINKDLRIEAKVYKSLNEAAEDNTGIFRVDPSLQLQGKVRIIVVDGFDANPCGGTHVRSLKEIGPPEMRSLMPIS
jgi:Ser-tRNA(Ala) deacylase AlaX